MTHRELDDLQDERERIDAQLLLRLRLVEAFHSGCVSVLDRMGGKPGEPISEAVDRIEVMTTEQLMDKHGAARRNLQ